MTELEHFYNEGFGWVCRRCERDLQADRTAEKRSRLMREGEDESKTPQMASRALAKWTDAARRTLLCPRCGATEPVRPA